MGTVLQRPDEPVMTPMDNCFDLPRLRERVKPFRVYYYPRLRSTNDQAAELRRRGDLYAPAIVLTANQTAGRGRGNNTWWSCPGSLTVTFVLPVDDLLKPHQLPLVAGLAVRNAAAELTGDPGIQLKWPNDLVYSGKKLGGLLCERVLNADLVGVGVNVNVEPSHAPGMLKDRIASLAQIRGGPLDLSDAVSLVAAHLRLTLSRATDGTFAPLLREYDAHHALLGRNVVVATAPDEPPVHGRCEGLDPMGRLLLRSRGRLHHIIAGQVRTR